MDQRNIEIKAKLADISEFEEKIRIAKELTGQHGEVIVQHDVFFKVPNGRLKMRFESSESTDGESVKLIQYSRENCAGPKLSSFNIIQVSDGKLMEQILSESIGILGELDKTRVLFMFEGRTRIHLDNVKNKGGVDFYGFELEVNMKPEESLELGNEIAKKLIAAFGLLEDQLQEGSYFEILNT